MEEGFLSKIFDPLQIIKIGRKQGLGPRTLNSPCPNPPGSYRELAMEDGSEIVFWHFRPGRQANYLQGHLDLHCTPYYGLSSLWPLFLLLL